MQFSIFSCLNVNFLDRKTSFPRSIRGYATEKRLIF
uniref:Uncharacterized protein n=1 Tax=Rhizophora mucronata TaxID=61149 RepID=A0A2P2QFG5_RHIMU